MQGFPQGNTSNAWRWHSEESRKATPPPFLTVFYLFNQTSQFTLFNWTRITIQRVCSKTHLMSAA